MAYKFNGLLGKTMQTARRQCLLALAVLSIVAPLFFPASAMAASPAYAATDQIGQPNVTSGNYNRTPTLRDNGFSQPTSTATDAVRHRLFVADSNNGRVLVFNLDTNNHLTSHSAAHVLGQPNFGTRFLNEAPNTSNMAAPHSLAYDAVGDRLFVSDGGYDFNRVLVFDTAVINNGEAAVHVLGAPDFTTNKSTPPAASASNITYANGVSFDLTGNRLFVADRNASRVLVFDTVVIDDGEDAAHVLGQTNFTDFGGGTSTTAMNAPRGVGFDDAGDRLFVADTENNRVVVFNVAAITNGEPAVNVLGQGDFISAGSSLSQTGMNQPADVDYDTANTRLFVNDDGNARALTFNVAAITNGEPATNVLGQPDFITGSNGVTANKLASNMVGGVEYDPLSQYAYITDTANNRVLAFNGAAITDGMSAFDAIGQTLDDGTPQFLANYPDNLHPLANSLAAAEQSTLDRVHHRMFVADRNNGRVNVYLLTDDNQFKSDVPDYVLGQESRTYSLANSGQRGLRDPASVAYDAERNLLFVADAGNHRVLVFDAANLSNFMEASHVLGQPDFTTRTSATSINGLSTPWALGFDESHNRLFVSTHGDNRVVVFDTTIISNGMDASFVLGAADFGTAGGGLSRNRFEGIRDFSYDSVRQRLFAADSANHRILVFDGSNLSNGMDASYVLGQQSFTTANVPGPTPSTMQSPGGIGYGSENDQLYVADTVSQRILLFDMSQLATGMDAMAVIGAENFTTNVAGTSDTQLSLPMGVVFDPGNSQLFVMDSGNSRIMRYEFIALDGLAGRSALVGNAVTLQLTTTGARGTVTYSLDGGTLPPGLVLDDDGFLSGYPYRSGTYTFTVRATDDTGSTGKFFTRRAYTFTVSSTITSISDVVAAAKTDPPKGPAAVLFSSGINERRNQPAVTFEHGTDQSSDETATKLYLKLLWWLPIIIPLIWGVILFKRRRYHAHDQK